MYGHVIQVTQIYFQTVSYKQSLEFDDYILITAV